MCKFKIPLRLLDNLLQRPSTCTYHYQLVS
ncbi:hypothetical protein VP501E541_P0256 [Vibrio phage 501E54-1]|nr:hypothetical protein VP501E541_P0256 [Vibrio phage 501E54-1]